MNLGMRWKIIGTIVVIESLLLVALIGATSYWLLDSESPANQAISISQPIMFLALLAILGVGLTAVLMYFLSSRFSNQLIRLTKTAKDIQNQGPGLQVDITETDEIGQLAHAFNQMSLSVAATQKELQASLAVQERLTELLDTHRKILDATISSAHDAVIVIDHNGLVVEFNKSAEHIFGYQRDELIGNELAEYIIPEKFRNAHRAGMERFRASGEAKVLGQRIELIGQHKDGREFPCELAIHGVKVGDETHFTAFMRDISERIDLEQELRLAGHAFDANEAIFITDAEANIVRVNQAFSRITGFQEADVLGKNPRLLSSNEHSAEFYQHMWQSLAKAGKWSGEITNRRKDGELLPELLSISSVQREDGSTSHYVAHFTDLREQKAVERSLRQAQTEAELASKAKSRFLATMSHEIRTPLNAIINMNRLLLETGLSDKQQHLVHAADDAGNVLLAIVNNVLDFSRIEAGQFALNPDWFNPLQVTQSLTELFQASAKQKYLQLTFEHMLENEYEIYGDALRFRQILLNLVGNAIKFTQQGEVKVTLSIDQSGVVVDVVDTGPGIAPDKQKHLFDEFYQLQDINSMERSGTGLGLAITKQLVEMMNGRIELESALGHGSKFSVWLPLKQRKAHPTETEATTSSAQTLPAKEMDILLVEDSASNRAVVHQVLMNLVGNVVDAENGDIAVKIASEKQFDLILMDVAMPVMNGLSATEILRQNDGPNRDTPIVAMTANAFKEDKQACLDAGMDDFLSKPVDISSLREKVSFWSNQRSNQWQHRIEHAERLEAEKQQVKTQVQSISESASEPYESIKLLEQEVLLALIQETSLDVVKRIFITFKEEAQARVFAVKVLSGKLDWQQVETEAHTLKSTMGTFGARRFQQLAKDIETAAKNQEQDVVANLEPRLQLMLDQTLPAIEQQLANLENHNKE